MLPHHLISVSSIGKGTEAGAKLSLGPRNTRGLLRSIAQLALYYPVPGSAARSWGPRLGSRALYPVSCSCSVCGKLVNVCTTLAALQFVGMNLRGPPKN